MKKYQVYNGYGTSLFAEDDIIEAKNGAEACKKLLDRIGVKYTSIKRSASNNVKIKVQPFYYNENGQKCRDGIVSWFEVWDNNNLIV
jgi:hypothetical protein